MRTFNQKKMNDTITKAERKQRLNLIRQINSRNYRIQNKLLVFKLNAFIRFTEKFASSNANQELVNVHTQFLGQVTKAALSNLNIGMEFDDSDLTKLIKTWAAPKDWTQLTTYKIECVKKHVEDQQSLMYSSKRICPIL